MKLRIVLILLLAVSPLTTKGGASDVLIIDWMHANGCLAALVANDYESFCNQGASDLRKNVPKEKFETLATELRPRMLAGYMLMDKGTIGEFPRTSVLWRLRLRRDSPAPSDEVIILMPNIDGKDIADFRILR